jgi:quercetin dioxygenase-like cupin family protein
MIIIEKGWGYEKWITNTNKYCGKLLHFKKGKKCSWHYHKIKDEMFYVHTGEIELTFGDDDSKVNASVVILKPGDSFHVKAGLRHQMKALEEADMFEFSTEHFEEDSYRVEKGD